MAVRCAILLSILALMASTWGASFSDSRNSSSSEENAGVTPAPNIHSIIQGLQKEQSGVAPNIVSPPGGAGPTFSGQGVSAGYNSGFQQAAPVGIPPDAGLPPPIPGLGPAGGPGIAGLPAPGLGGYPGLPAPGIGGYPGLPAPGFGGFPGLGLGGLPGLGLGGLLPGLGLGGPPFGGPLDSGIGPGIGGGIVAGGYFPIIKKIIIVVGLGILFLVIVALINGALAGAGWIAQDWGFGGIGGGFSKGAHLDASINTPVGSASTANSANIELADRVNNAVNAKF